MSNLDVVKIYDELHKMPELGFEEVKTSEYLAAELEKLGYKVTKNIGVTGIIGELKGAEPGPTLMLRADMDALPFVIDGKDECRHACGHDAHCAMALVAAANAVAKVKKGTLKILFQPGEETLKGALAVMEEGALEGVDYVIGLHIRPVQDIPGGTMSPAVNHASSTFIHVDVEGVGAHGSRPHLGVNAVETAALITNAIMAMKLNPTMAWSCKVTGITGGTVANIIPDHAKMVIDARAQTNELMEDLLAKFHQAVEGAATAMGAKAVVSFPGGVIPAAELNPDMTKLIAECIVDVVGEEKLRPEIINPGGEDFHYFARKIPSIKAGYFGVGSGAAPGLHDKDMALNPESLKNGVAVLEKVVERILG